MAGPGAGNGRRRAPRGPVGGVAVTRARDEGSTVRVDRQRHGGGRVRRSSAGRRAVAVLVAAGVVAGPLAGSVVADGPAGAAPVASAGAPCQDSTPVTPAAAASTTGITPTSVTVGNISIISGPVPGLFKGAPTGAQAYFAYINSKGGVNGRKLKLDSYDDGFNGQTNATETTTAVAKDFALVGNFSLFDSSGCKILAENSAVPDVSVTLDPGTNSLPNVFSAQPLATGWSLGPLQYYKQHFPGATKVGSLVSNIRSSITSPANRRNSSSSAICSISGR